MRDMVRTSLLLAFLGAGSGCSSASGALSDGGDSAAKPFCTAALTPDAGDPAGGPLPATLQDLPLAAWCNGYYRPFEWSYPNGQVVVEVDYGVDSHWDYVFGGPNGQLQAFLAGEYMCVGATADFTCPTVVVNYQYRPCVDTYGLVVRGLCATPDAGGGD